MSTERLKAGAVAALSALTLVANTTAASAQPFPPPPPGGEYGPPPGAEYAPPPGDEYGPPPGAGAYAPRGAYGYGDDPARYDEAYSRRYSAWASRYCVERHNQNVAAGAIIGLGLGAILGAAAGGRYNSGGGAIVGGALGAGAGASIGGASTPEGCPPGYVVRNGAPHFFYGGPVVYAPVGYNPWVWGGGRWSYVPYRSWYWRRYGWRR